MSDTDPLLEPDEDIEWLTREERHTLLLQLETATDTYLTEGSMSQEEAWDSYFGLLHECDESRFLNDRPRILAKIDTQKYNPYRSKSPGIVALARLRSRGSNIVH